MKESGILTTICQYLQYLENQGKLIYQRNNSGAFINPKGNFYRMGKRGMGDIIIWLPDGKSMILEVKNETGKLSLSQLEMELKLKQLNHLYFIVRSLEEVENIFKKLKNQQLLKPYRV